MGFPPGELPIPGQGFFDMGMDSLLALDLKNRLQDDLGLSLPSTLTLEYPTVMGLAEYLNQQIFQSSGRTPTAPPEQNTVAPPEPEPGAAGLDASIAEELAGLESILRQQ